MRFVSGNFVIMGNNNVTFPGQNVCDLSIVMMTDEARLLSTQYWGLFPWGLNSQSM
jgi:hypothetical protein